MRSSFVTRVAATFAVLALAACNNNGEGCSGEVRTAAQIGNTLHASGTFRNGQPVLTLTRNGSSSVIASTASTTTGAEFDISGLAAGVYSASWEMSCYNDNGDVVTVTSHVPTVTIQ